MLSCAGAKALARILTVGVFWAGVVCSFGFGFRAWSAPYWSELFWFGLSCATCAKATAANTSTTTAESGAMYANLFMGSFP
jgi:hypothetical protein